MNRKITILGIFLTSLILFGSCKPKQSAYKSVYEAAKEKEMGDNEEDDFTNGDDVVIKDNDLPRPMPLPTYPPTTSNNNNSSNSNSSSVAEESVRKEKVTPVYDADARELKAYNIVIAAMGMKPNAESLKGRMENEGYKIILVQNEQGMYRVIIGSFNSRSEASARKNEILTNFSAKGDQATLRSRFGIPFDDWWILQRDF